MLISRSENPGVPLRDFLFGDRRAAAP